MYPERENSSAPTAADTVRAYAAAFPTVALAPPGSPLPSSSAAILDTARLTPAVDSVSAGP
ncbi:unknown [Candidatus Colimorpha enterica]|uniref:Uncharacterized protein n=1 Tax=Candidatus Colimorpha enterica TaxID=3083063 RepID=R6TTN9_9BACT|nr:unknown [Candidatus Colimorpha enterica]